MSYEQVKTPRFWVSTLQWLSSKGLVYQNTGGSRIEGHEPKIFNINPTSKNILTPDTDFLDNNFIFGLDIDLSSVMRIEDNFTMILGHNFKNNGINNIILKNLDSGSAVTEKDYVNGTNIEISHNGFSINTFYGNGDGGELQDTMNFNINTDGWSIESFNIGCILYGNYYTMPHSPDLNLTLTREYATKTIETKGGSTLSNSYWTKQPDWCNGLPAWQLSDDVELLAPLASSGRRIWSLSFSYLDEKNLFAENSSLRDLNMEQEFLSNNSNANFFSDVIHKTVGLPFVFQPDSNDTTNFAICMFDQNSFKFKQVANGVYNISMTIREVW